MKLGDIIAAMGVIIVVVGSTVGLIEFRISPQLKMINTNVTENADNITKNTELSSINHELIKGILNILNPTIIFPGPNDKIVDISKDTLLASKTNKEVISIKPNEYRIIQIEVTPSEELNLSLAVLTPKNNFINYYIYDSQGDIKGAGFQKREFSRTLKSKCSMFYVYIDNTFDSSNPKSIGISLSSSNP